VRHKPHGVMAVLGPYNFPAHLPNGHIVPALIAGNAVIFKPSGKDPGHRRDAAGGLLPPRRHSEAVVQLLIGGPEEGKALVAHDGIDGVLFTGSAQVGIAINRKLATNPGKIVALEMGGNNPLVVWDTPKITDAAALIVQSAFTTAGQRCTAARRLIVKDRRCTMRDGRSEAAGRPDHRRRAVRRAAAVHGPGDRQRHRRRADRKLPLFAVRGGRAIKHLRRRPILPFLTPGIIDVTAMKERPMSNCSVRCCR
jgi:succinylglutamic semialdehyde dehydrogenase